jgi:hypothetical protein
MQQKRILSATRMIYSASSNFLTLQMSVNSSSSCFLGIITLNETFLTRTAMSEELE